ncbi:unnamed protein product [Lactuca virosa]|uniref:Uncharacterized protein n=1 Tax=Lactuca virosa TaxID=75947 RepID=A0AAU9MAM6_9ASTR|nr:unnamed protein product [Lactuca virosa]
MGFSPKPSSKKDFRSITLPFRSHPCTYRIDKVLNKVKTWESTSSLSNPSAEIICSDSSNQNMRWTDELLDRSVIFLDIFSDIYDLMLQTKEHVRDLGCDLRRNGGPSIDIIIDNNTAFRRKLRKDIHYYTIDLHPRKLPTDKIRGLPTKRNLWKIRGNNIAITHSLPIDFEKWGNTSGLWVKRG